MSLWSGVGTGCGQYDPISAHPRVSVMALVLRVGLLRAPVRTFARLGHSAAAVDSSGSRETGGGRGERPASVGEGESGRLRS